MYCTPKWKILSPGGCPDACQLLYSSKTLLLCQIQPAQAPGGHPRQLIANGQFLLAQRVTPGAADTGSQFKRLSDLNVTIQTVINTLRKAGLKTAIEKKRPLLSRAHWQGSLGAPVLDSGGLGQDELVT